MLLNHILLKIRFQIATLFWNDKAWPFDFTHDRFDSDDNNEYVKQIYKNLVEPDCKKYRCTREFKDSKNKKRNKERYKNSKNDKKDSPYQYNGKKKKFKLDFFLT